MSANQKLRFQNKIDKQLAKRNKELAQLDLLFQTTSPEEKRNIINRLIIPHIYSHYEGFIKSSSILFLKYIIATYDPKKDLSENIFALNMRKLIKNSSKSNKIKEHMDLINKAKTKPAKLEFNPEQIIDTHDNLKSEYLKEIMYTCGIQYDEYWQEKSFFIDFILLKNRNLISHGELSPINDETVLECLNNVIDILITFKKKLEEKI